MKKEFERPELVIVFFNDDLSTEDEIITVSNPSGGSEGEMGSYNL